MIAQESNPILKLQGLCKDFPIGRFRRKFLRALDNINMEVGTGETRGIVGESGAGKSTLARCGLLLLKPSSGSVHFNGEDLDGLSPACLRAKRREFQMVFQDPYASLNPAMTVEEILMEPLQVHKMGDPDHRLRCVRESMEAVALSESLMNRRPAELSGGQQQRVGIARGLILKPRLVVADEPISALDASVQAQILNLMADLKKQYSHTLILISHSLSALHYLCTHISVLYRGRLVEEAAAEIFFKEPKHPYSKNLLHASLAMDSREGNPIHSPIAESAPPPDTDGGCAYRPYCPHRLPVCAQQSPQLCEVKKGEKVACFLYSRGFARIKTF